MADHQQKCGKCGAVNPAEAVTCVNCGTVLAAYAPASAPVSDPPPVPTAESVSVESQPEPVADPGPESQPGKPTEKSSDWRDLFSQPPGASEPALSFDALPAAPAIPEPPEPASGGFDETRSATESSPSEAPPETMAAEAVATPAPTTSIAPSQPVSPQPAPSRPRTRAHSVPTPEPPSFDSRMARFDRGISNRSPQKLMLYGILIFVLGCVLAMILSATGVSDTLVGLLFICAGPLGLIVFVIGIILAVARREGRQR